MAVGRLDITTYETARGPYHTERIENPTWEAIQAAINRLDRCFYPFIFLYRDANAREEARINGPALIYFDAMPARR